MIDSVLIPIPRALQAAGVRLLFLPLSLLLLLASTLPPGWSGGCCALTPAAVSASGSANINGVPFHAVMNVGP